ncbi:MAG: PKD domain-containing protein [bacterium]|nr:PKD domain-containing protein [bacterium]
MKYNRLHKIILYMLAVVSLAMVTGCGGSVKTPFVVSDISGPGSIDENQVADYSVTAENGHQIQYAWTVDPASAGSFVNADKVIATFHANECVVNTIAKIRVSVTPSGAETEVAEMEITIMDTNQAPHAVASSDVDRIGHGQVVQFYDESTDPEGDTDIVKWEWDFNYDGNTGFNGLIESREPRHQFGNPGTFRVQLRVTDKSGITDLLDEPLSIEVVENFAPEIIEITHSRTTSQAGNDSEAVQLEVVFSDMTPPSGPHDILWTCDYGQFDDFTSPNPTWFPPDSPVQCDITVKVTDEFELSDSASIHQWVTHFPTINNPSAPGNIVGSLDFDTTFTGTVNPSDYIFPNDGGDGTIIFTSYWVSWSSTCLDGIPFLLAINDLYKDEDYIQFMINEGDSKQDVTDFVNLNGYTSDIWALDTDASYFNLSKGWNSGSSTLPQHMLFDRDGRCRWASVGILNMPFELHMAVAELL